MTTFTRYLILFALLVFAQIAKAQRIYGTSQEVGASGLVCLNCTVNNAANAVDGNPQTYSTINVAVGLAAQTRQEVIFSSAVAANTPVSLKLGTGDNLLSLQALGGVFIRPYNGSTPAGPAVTAASLLTALSNNNQVELTITPAQAYDRVRVTLDGGIAGVLASIYLYEVYYRGPGPVACGSAVDELHGISSALLGLGLNVGGVANPQQAIDGDINTASTLNAGVAVAGAYAQQTILFNSASTAGDSVKLTLSIPQTLVDAGVLTRISLHTYNGNTSNTDEVFLNSSLLTVRLLDLSAGRRRVTVTYVPQNVFDRIQLRLGGGIANVLSSLNLHEVQKLIPVPVISFNGSAAVNVRVCAGAPVTLTAAALPNTIFNWYTQASGGSPVFSGNSLTSGALSNSTIFYVEATRTGCTDASARIAIPVTVNPVPAAPVVSNNTQSICSGSTATFSAQAVTGVTINWYDASTGGTLVFSGNSFTTPALMQTTTYYAEALSTGNCSSAQRTAVTATVNPAPVLPALSATNLSINAGQTATVTVTNSQPGTQYNWYDAASGGILVHSGTSFTTPTLNSNRTYYVEALAGVCIAASRVAVSITINSSPDLTITPPVRNINPGQSTSFTASSSTPGAVFNWYDVPSGGGPIFTGVTFTTPPLNSNTTYYAEAVNPGTGATSARGSASVVINNAPGITVTPPSRNINAGQSTTFTASSNMPGAVFNWYDSPVGGTLLFSGATFTTPTLTANTMYYAEAVDPATGATSARATASVTINNVPDITITPPVRTINAGQTTSFTASSSRTGVVFNWYDVSTGGSPIFTGATFTSQPLNTNTAYYAEAVDPATGATSVRDTAWVIINSAPNITVTPPSRNVNAGQTANFTASSSTPNAVFNWYDSPNGGSPIFTGANFTTPPVNSNTTYYVEAVDPATGATSPRATASVTINGVPDLVVTPPTRTINPGQSASFTASSTVPGAVFNWYDTPNGGSPIFTGPTFTTPPVSANTIYYAEAVNPATGATSPRATASVNVNGTPDLTITPPTRNINPGQSTSFTASSSATGAVFNWYDTPNGGSPIYTGSTYTTPPLSTNTTYYVEAVDPATGATSARGSASVTVNGVPNITVTPPTRNINSGQSTSFTASSSTPGAIYNWYDVVNGGSPIFTGATFTTPPLTANTTYYVEAVDPVTYATSVRATATATINGAPNITVTPPSRSINPGQTASFTASSSTQGAVFNWYDAAIGGTPIFTGATFTSPPLNANATYYAEAVNPTTGATSPRATASVVLNGVPDLTVSPPTQAVNPGQTASFTASSSTPGTVFNWYDSPGSTTPIYTGPAFTTPPITGNVTYYVEAVNPGTGATSARSTASVVVNNAPDLVIVPPSRNINPGQSASFTASSSTPGAIFHWYDTPTGGSPLFTGTTFTSPALNSNTSYYAEAVNPATGATSARGTVSVVINGVPNIAVTPPTQAINAGQTATFTASSSTPGAVFNWYDDPNSGIPFFTGATYTTPALNTNTVYHVEAVDPATNAESARVTASVTINTAPDIRVTPPTATINSGQTATFTASSGKAGAIFRWYDSPTGGTVLFTGAVFTTPALNSNTTYYVEAADPATGATSARISASVHINGIPTIAVTPPVRNINAGQTTTFTASSNLSAAIFRWYSANESSPVIFTGATFTTPPLNANTTYYVEAVDPATGAVSARAIASVTVNGVPNVTVTPPVRNITTGQTASFTASSTTAMAVFRWYTTSSGGTPIFTGANFVSPRLGINTVYYAEAFDPATNTVSARATATVMVNGLVNDLYIPNAFTPNADGRNDQFTILGNAVTDFDFRVYNQWGQLLFRSRDKNVGWDGTWRGVEQPVGVYVYVFEGMAAGEKVTRKGTITLIR